MPRIEIYTKFLCPYCSMAKSLLRDKGAEFEEVDVTMDADRRKVMIDRAGGRTTVPQIFIDGTHVGGCDDLVLLEDQGKLDAILAT